MRATMSTVLPDVAAFRRKTGADRRDEIWEGVLHMVPMPNSDHQDLEGAMESWLRIRWVPTCRGRVYHEVNLASVGGWPDNYRIPDLLMLLPARRHINKNDYFEGAPDVVVEIRSPGDESYEKLSFYKALGVPEVWIIDRDTKFPEIFALAGADGYDRQPPGSDGWLRSGAIGVDLRATPDARLQMRLRDDMGSFEALPPEEED